MRVMLELATRLPNGEIDFRPHRGQWRAWNSTRRFILVLAGTQGGKTAFGPHWLLREIQERGPGDYMVVTPVFPLLEKKALPEFRKLFERWYQLGRYYSSPIRRFEVSPDGARRLFGHYSPDTPSTVWFGYAEDPESLESATAKAAWCDEAGQKKFKLASWEALLRRLSLAMGRVLLTTTPYDLGWLKQQIYDRWRRIGSKDERPGDRDFDVIRFDSTENPAFPKEEFERARESLPSWKFNLFYRAIFSRPAGMIYDSFDEDRHKIPRFDLPSDWPRFLGLDFGGVNTAGMFYAEDPGSRPESASSTLGAGDWFAYREYKAGGRTAAEHCFYLMQGEPRRPHCVGGSKSEGQWRQEFRAGGLVNGVHAPGIPVQEPTITDVEVGIGRVYGAHKRNEIFVFNDLNGYLEQKMTYSRELDDLGQPTEKIEAKETFHFLDAERYVVSRYKGDTFSDKVLYRPTGILGGFKRARG
jgi:hypothetical protein